jgi:hypothetical protein
LAPGCFLGVSFCFATDGREEPRRKVAIVAHPASDDRFIDSTFSGILTV